MKDMVSIIIPAYNRINRLISAIKSVQKQTYENLEIIIVDDYSTDNLKEVVQTIANHDKRVRYILNERKKGISGARNTGVLNSRGKYIAFLDSDDIWERYHIERVIEAMIECKEEVGFSLWYEGRKENLIAIGNSKEFLRGLERTKKEINVNDKGKYYIFDRDFFQYTIITYFYCYHLNTMIISRNKLLECGLFDESLTSSEDCKFLFSVLDKSRFVLYLEHQYYYYYWTDSTYAFIDRSQINISKVIKDRNLVRIITHQVIEKIKVRRYSWRLVKKSKYCDKKKECHDVIFESIYNKYMTLGVLNQENSISKSIGYFIKALQIKVNWEPLYMIGLLLWKMIIKNDRVMVCNKAKLDFF